MLSSTSVFRRLPLAMRLSHRRLLGALAYAYDGAELSFSRLREAARAYRLPGEDKDFDAAGWLPANRLSIVTDAWAFIDHVNRARKLLRRFPIGDPPPAEVDVFITATKPATDIRNRLQHLDEDIFTGANSAEGNPVLGAVSWADARGNGGHVRYSVASGPSIDAGKMGETQLTDVDGAGDVLDFRLMAADHTARLDDLRKTFVDFMEVFEQTVARSIRLGLREAAAANGVPLERVGQHGVTDMTMALRMRRKPEGGWQFDGGDGFGRAEVAPGFIDPNDWPDESA